MSVRPFNRSAREAKLTQGDPYCRWENMTLMGKVITFLTFFGGIAKRLFGCTVAGSGRATASRR
jgi:hypothetical protein